MNWKDVPDEFKTKEGYLKDGFVVPDDNDLEDIMEDSEQDNELIIEYDGECEEDEYDESDDDSELSEDKYFYSDEEL